MLCPIKQKSLLPICLTGFNMKIHLPKILVWIFILIYFVYFSAYSVQKYHHLYSNYFDLGIMNQTVHNSYMALRTGDAGRILELTDPHGSPNQIKRMAIHNDPFLALLAPFYFIHDGPETLLLLQTIALALGAWTVFLCAERVLKNEWISLGFAVAYLMYSPMQFANIFDFHAVTIATTMILFMVYFWLTKQYKLSLLFMGLALLTKEEAGLSIGVFGLYTLFEAWNSRKNIPQWYPAIVTSVSWIWSLLSAFVIIPFFNNGHHFASGYYDNLLPNVTGRIFKSSTGFYFLYTMGPLLFLPLLAPLFLIVATPELGINLLSANEQLRDLGFHYASIIQPWFFIGAIFGAKAIGGARPKIARLITIFLVISSVIFAYLNGPLPFTQSPQFDAFKYTRPGESRFAQTWAVKLKDDNIRVSSTDEIAPFFSSRRYFYIFSHNYTHADYVVISRGNLEYTYRKDEELPAYESLKKDSHFTKIYSNRDGYEVYKKQ